MIVSIHLPKTAGTSFRQCLREHFDDRLLEDYGDPPLAHAPEARLAAARCATGADWRARVAAAECIHGHFLAAKYLPLESSGPLQFVTWLRHPVARLASHYRYWQRDADGATITALRRQMLAEQWDFRTFALHPFLKDLYSSFLQGIELARFAFVGITEHYEQDLSAFCSRFLGKPSHPARENVGTAASVPLARELEAEIEDFHAADLALYRAALTLREHRRRQDDLA